MNKIEKPIVILDMGINSLMLVNIFRENYPNDDIVYINDLKTYEYEGLEVDEIKNKILELLVRVKKYDPKLVVLSNDTIIEYGKELIQQELEGIPFVNIVDEIIRIVNLKYEFKNIAFFAPIGIIESNMYQHNFNYTRLYNLDASILLDDIRMAKMKTANSFEKMRLALLPVFKKEIDVIVPTIPNLLLFKTEIYEYVKSNSDLLNIDEVILEKAKELLKPGIGKNKKYVYLDIMMMDDINRVLNKILSVKYKLMNKGRK